MILYPVENKFTRWPPSGIIKKLGLGKLCTLHGIIVLVILKVSSIPGFFLVLALCLISQLRADFANPELANAPGLPSMKSALKALFLYPAPRTTSSTNDTNSEERVIYALYNLDYSNNKII